MTDENKQIIASIMDEESHTTEQNAKTMLDMSQLIDVICDEVARRVISSQSQTQSGSG